MKEESTLLPIYFLGASLLAFTFIDLVRSMRMLDQVLLWSTLVALTVCVSLWLYTKKSPQARAEAKRKEAIDDLPEELIRPSSSAVELGIDTNLRTRIYLTDAIRKRHVHIIGSTGSGKTESVILNLIRQDVTRGKGAIILDAKGDIPFLNELKRVVPLEKLQVFDLGDAHSAAYDPLTEGSSIESAQRLFASLTWSEEYYKSKALSVLQRIFAKHFSTHKRNPTLKEIADYLLSPKRYAGFVTQDDYPKELAFEEFKEISGLRDQIRTLTTDYLSKTLSGASQSKITLGKASSGGVIYLRLQSLLSTELVSMVGKLAINHLNFLAGKAHRGESEGKANDGGLVPVYVDEFASFACPEFGDLISKARSANFALHFSHQSVGDLVEVSEGFLSRITDNSATKIVMRINDPDTAEYFARSFGTKEIQKTTQRITNTQDMDDAEIVGEGTSRDAHQFRASPDLLKTLPTGYGSVLVAHGRDGLSSGSHVFKIQFPYNGK